MPDPVELQVGHRVVLGVAQCSAHGAPVPCTVRTDADGLVVTFTDPQRRVAPGQTVALYDLARPDSVVGSGVVR